MFDRTSLFDDDAITYAGERLELADAPGLPLGSRACLEMVVSEGKSEGKEVLARRAVQPQGGERSDSHCPG